MGYIFELPEVIPLLRNKVHKPWRLGLAVGVMLYRISPLLSTHLDNSVHFQNPVPTALTCMTGFVSVIDQYIAYLRLTDDCTDKFPNDLDGVKSWLWRKQKRDIRFWRICRAASPFNKGCTSSWVPIET
jgi:hypothetical protein